STTSSPRMPCALRTRPTMISSGGELVIVLGRRFLARLAKRNRGRRQLASEPRFVASLEHARLAKQGANRVGWLRSVVEPIVDSIAPEVERELTLSRSVLADDLDELSVARAARIGNDNTIRRLLFATGAAQANLD